METQRNKRIITPFTQAELDAIEEYWHEQRLPSRSAAIRDLIHQALDRARVVEAKHSRFPGMTADEARDHAARQREEYLADEAELAKPAQ